MKASIIIPTYNRREMLARSLPCYLNQDFPADDYEVVVVVDGSTDGTADFLRALKPRCRLAVVEIANGGQSVARNEGIEAARGEVLLFVDDDVICGERLLSQHVAAHKDPRITQLVFGPLRLSPASPRGAVADWMGRWLERYYGQLADGRRPDWPEYAVVNPNSSVPRAAVVAAGGWDPAFFRSHEDVDLGLRLWKLGVRFIYEPQATAEHIFVRTDAQMRRAASWAGRAELLLCRKHPEYRRDSWLAGLSASRYRRPFIELAVRSPISPEPLLRATSQLADLLPASQRLRNIAGRVLSTRRSIIVFRSACEAVGSWEDFRKEFGMNLPVLAYHHVGRSRPGAYPWISVSPQAFARQMQWLFDHDYTGITPSQWLSWCASGMPLPAKPVLLTFDDAYAETAEHAFPVLVQHGFGAGVYAVTGEIGGCNRWDLLRGGARYALMTAETISYWAQRGIEFGAHSRTHIDLTRASDEQLQEEIAGSKSELESLLGTDVTSFAYPYGRYDERVRRAVAGTFPMAFSVQEGMNTLRTDLLGLRRNQVHSSDSLWDFACRVRFGQSLRQRLRLNLRTLAGLRS